MSVASWAAFTAIATPIVVLIFQVGRLVSRVDMMMARVEELERDTKSLRDMVYRWRPIERRPS